MNRRNFLFLTAAAGVCAVAPSAFAVAHQTQVRSSANILILVELKGGNDGLNTVIPFADPAYAALRPKIGIRREQVVQLDDRTGLHPAMQSLMPLWRDRQLAIVQGVGYPQPNLSHFRSAEIWETASRSDQYLRDGWLARSFGTHEPLAATQPLSAQRVARGAAVTVIGSAEMGPFTIGGRGFVYDSSHGFSYPFPRGSPAALAIPSPFHTQLFKTQFPAGTFGTSVRTAMHMLASDASLGSVSQALRGVSVIRLTLNGFDTHQNQPGHHASLLRQLSEGIVAIRSALTEAGCWNQTLVMTYSEFGRRPRENSDRGTDHGTVAPHFLTGGRVKGGLYGVAPALARLDGNSNLPVGVDFRELYATVLGPWLNLDSTAVLGQRFKTLPLLKL
jgi:uncharacterized protein (DUF1501 family)